MRKSKPTATPRGSPLVVRPLLAALAAAGLALPLAAPAATIVVNTGGDAGGGGTCTLRQAVTTLNTTVLQGNCSNSGAGFGTNDTVDLSLRSGTITLGGTEIPVSATSNVYLKGPAAGPTVLTISGGNASRVFSITGNAPVQISRLTIANGNASGSGGCILSVNDSEVTLTDSIVKTCVANTQVDSTDFTTAGLGGGIAAYAVVLERSTVSGNTATAGGGIFGYYVGTYLSAISNNTVRATTCTTTTQKYSCYASLLGGGGVFSAFMYAYSSTIAGNTVNASTITNDAEPPVTYRVAVGGGVTVLGFLPVTNPEAVVAGKSALMGRVLQKASAARAERTALAGRSTLSGRGTLAAKRALAGKRTLAGKASLAGKSASAAKRAGVGNAGVIFPDGKYGLGLINTTVSGNSLAGVGGLPDPKYLGGGVFTLAVFSSNATVSGNTATAIGYGGGIFSTNMVLHNSTIAGNTGIGGLMAVSGSPAPPVLAPAATSPPTAIAFGTFEITSTIVANNTGPGKDIECFGSSCTFIGNTSLVRTPGINVTLPPGTIVGQNPLLGPLTGNGGFFTGAPGDPGTAVIKTMLPQLDSPAIDNGSDPDQTEFDERGPGFPRVIGAAADIGAVEVGGVARTVPTLAAWPLAMLSALLGVLGWRTRRRSG